MHTSVLANLPTPSCGLKTRLAALLMVSLCGSLVLYPLLHRWIAPFVGLSFGLATLLVSVGVVQRNLRIPSSVLTNIWIAFMIIYDIWFIIALIYGNTLRYIYQDSAGFLLYLGALPVIYLLVQQNNLQRLFFSFVERLSQLIGAASVILAVIIYGVMGEISSESITLINAYAFTMGLSWSIDHNHGLLGLYTNVAHFMLLGSALAFYRFYLFGRRRDVFLILLYLTAFLLDGRRALVIAAFMQIVIVALPRLKMLLFGQHMMLALVMLVGLIVFIISNKDWIQQRFNFYDVDASSAERYAQIPALLDKIVDKPVFGGGFGSIASYIRSFERPFSYEVDFLATFMKLGMVGGILYFGTYLFGVAQALRIRGPLGLYLISAGLPFFFYMGTNGNQAMSTDSAIFHIFLFMMIAFTLPNRGRLAVWNNGLRSASREPQKVLSA